MGKKVNKRRPRMTAAANMRRLFEQFYINTYKIDTLHVLQKQPNFFCFVITVIANSVETRGDSDSKSNRAKNNENRCYYN